MMFFFFLYIVMFIFLFLFFYFFFNMDVMKMLPPILPVILLVALFTLLESKLLGGMQSSSGPNVVGFFGLLQPFADAFKLMFKETILPGLSNLLLFIISPIISFTVSLLSWSVIPFSHNLVLSDVNLSVMFLLSISSFGVYGMIMSGWSSNSKYAFLGSLSSAAQFISYEVSIGMMIMVMLLCVGSLNLNEIILFQNNLWFIFFLFPSFILFFIAALAETNSIPFDLPEAESELVSGYNVEYASTTFVLFFLAEYSNMLMMSVLMVMFFFGGYLPFMNFVLFYFFPLWLWFILKVLMMVCLFVWVRGTLPRYSYDQLMNMGWKVLLPISLSYLFIVSVLFWMI